MEKKPPTRKSQQIRHKGGASRGQLQAQNSRKSKTRATRPQRNKRDRDAEVPEVSLDVLSDTLMAMLRDVRDLQPRYGNADFRRDVTTLSRRLASEGVRFATERLPAFFDGLLGYLETGKSDFPGFKIPGTRQYPAFLQGLVAPIYEDFVSSTAVKNVGLLYQFCVAFKKLKGPYSNKVLVKQLDDFVQTDISLNDVDLSSEVTRDIARDAKASLSELLMGLDPHDPEQAIDFVPRPGPGATNTPTEHASRFHMGVDYPELTSVFNPETWFRPPFAKPRGFMYGDVLGLKESMANIASNTRVSSEEHKPYHYIEAAHAIRSRFKSVPKTFAKPRGICIEENEVQWHQQAIRRALVRRIESHPLTRGFVNFTDQLINRKLALVGSSGKKWATIDMSSASDRISRAMVAYLFGANKALLAALMAVSTEEVEIPKVQGFNFIDVLPVKKFAPMGSAICFPVMALVHWSLIKAILDRSSLSKTLTREVYVYGDDIIVRAECAQAIYDYLPLFGMRINVEKSYSHSYFRESCGLHAYKGVDVTPVRVKSLLSNSSSPQELATALRLEEALNKKGYSETAGVMRALVQKVARKYGIYTVPYVHTESSLFGFFRNDEDANLEEFTKLHKRRWVPAISKLARDEMTSSMFNASRSKTGLRAPMVARVLKEAERGMSQTWLYPKVATIVDSFDDKSSFPCEEDRYLRYLTMNGKWASQKYDERYSRDTMFRKQSLQESALGYRC